VDRGDVAALYNREQVKISAYRANTSTVAFDRSVAASNEYGF